MIKTKILAFYFLTINIALAQNFQVQIKNLNKGKAYVNSLSGEKMTLIDSVTSTPQGEIKFNLGNNTHAGFYRLTIAGNKWIDFINDGENIKLETDAGNILDSLKVISSESNRLFYAFVKLNKQYKTKSELLQLILARYPKDDNYYQTTQKRLLQLQQEYLDFVNQTAQAKPGSFVARYISSSQLPIIDSGLPMDKQLAYLKAHALDKIDFKDAMLIYSDMFTNKTIEYLTYYRNPQMPKELLEKEFTIAVDSVLSRARVHLLVYQHIVEYLIDGFKKFGFDSVLDYIVKNYVVKDDLCLDEKLENSIQRRLEQNKKLPVGAIATNIVMQNSDGKEINIAQIKTEKILIAFYASWCPHCQTLMPELQKFYKEQKANQLEVVAISLDNKKDEWINFIKNNKLDWINLSDQLGWDSKAAKDYYIYATPTMFLLDRTRKIIGKPLTMDEVKSMIR